MEPRPTEDEDGLGTAIRLAQLVSLALYCVVLWQVVASKPTAIDRAWSRLRPVAQRSWRRATVPWQARRQAPYVVWEAIEIVEGAP